MTARIILLNGVGSVGKSSIARALQTLAAASFLHVEMDSFLQMLPAAMIGHPDGLCFQPTETDGFPSVAISVGPVARRAFQGMRHAVAAMAAQGNDQIVDDVILSDGMAEYARLLAGFRFYRVGVFAPLAVLEERERARGDRLIGLARWQFDRVHKGVAYDLEIDAATATPLECAALIQKRFAL